MSVAAAAVLMTSGAFAFETNTKGEIRTSTNKLANYSFGANNAAVANVLNVNQVTEHGDALLYPYFTQKDGWGSEVYVRNDSDNSIVAKVVLYSANDTQEVADWNIYLSPRDAYRFKIENGKVELNEDSVATIVPRPQDNNLQGEYDEVLFGNEHPVTLDVNGTDIQDGYVVIYAMAQVADVTGDPLTNPGHTNHQVLFAHYRNLLDTYRPTWRAGYADSTIFEGGAYLNGIAAPVMMGNLNSDITGNIPAAYPASRILTWEDPAAVLTGTVRTYHNGDADVNARAMILNAVPFDNYTDGTTMLWSEGETAALADRRMATDYSAQAVANSDIYQDAVNAFSTVPSFKYTFDNADGVQANKLIFTQPFKRTLTQLGNLDGLWVRNAALGAQEANGLFSGEEFYFSTNCRYWDESENRDKTEATLTTITSPYTPDPLTITMHSKEVAQFANADLEMNPANGFSGQYDNVNGYADCSITTRTAAGVATPAIVTEMIATIEGERALTNWVYSVR